MKRKKLKQLLHQRREVKRAQEPEINDKQDDQLQINYVKTSELTRENETAQFNKVRRKNVKEVLNKLKHPFSQHIRLKPYYEADDWLHWIGVLSDLTLPNAADNLNGDILIDKLTTGDFKELLDYHVWLNLENVKYIKAKKQKLGIGDLIEGKSKILRYGQNKYGLGTTIIRRAGIYKGEDRPETLVGNYDRQDDWVLEIDNSSASERAWAEYQETKSLTAFEQEPGHVETRYQPSRYQRYRERLEEVQRHSSDSVLPLVPSTLNKYHAEVDQIHAAKSKTVSYRIPQLQLKNVVNEHHRLVAAKVVLPYTQEMKKMGELLPNDEVTFESKSNPDSNYLFGTIEKFNLVTAHEYHPLPEFPNTFLGYLMWKTPSEGSDPSLVMNYQNWALARGIHVKEIKKEIEEIKPERLLTEHELAIRFGVTDGIITSAYEQGVITPAKEEDGRKYDLTAWKTLMELLAAQDPHSILTVKKDLNVYSEDDFVQTFKLSLDEVRNQIKAANYLPLNGFHYKVNLYGPKVYQMFKAAKAVKQALPKKSEVLVKREIPRDKDVKIAFLERPKEVKSLPAPQKRSVTKTTVKQTQVEKKTTVTLEIETFDGSFLIDEFSSLEEADQVIEASARDKYRNHFLHVIAAESGEKVIISTKAITSFKVR
ncbi:molybdenum ABC transporter ATP-binding protein [Lactobacillus xujianguonis]|uniref:Molybdenum ABC transporter ATP-binding protein n=1 Tax=Lactobacillus xujianguonis TaxID=2495899 RepID=A0A437SU65_9LACO|nr:molybdenum ABC transporter ATP-binding protein [Lactobacillus xujianguonis]RVU70479.1 molybdenum ABC transporter ATP-binding protein [Lactobacillus xujianguonis]